MRQPEYTTWAVFASGERVTSEKVKKRDLLGCYERSGGHGSAACGGKVANRPTLIASTVSPEISQVSRLERTGVRAPGAYTL